MEKLTPITSCGVTFDAETQAKALLSAANDGTFGYRRLSNWLNRHHPSGLSDPHGRVADRLLQKARKLGWVKLSRRMWHVTAAGRAALSKANGEGGDQP